MNPEQPINPEDKNAQRANEALEAHQEAKRDLNEQMNRINKTWDEAQEVIENVKELSQKGEEIREELKAEGRWNKENRELYQALQQFIADIKKEQAQHIKSAEREFREIAQNAEEIRKEIKRRLPKS